MSDKFLYFAYGSNLLSKRIHINNPSAVRAGIGKIKDYQLDFACYSNRWKGAAATIVKNIGKEVWGAIWEIDQKHLLSLDMQEGVPNKVYFAHEVEVFLPDGNSKKCRIYEQCNIPSVTEKLKKLDEKRKPSAVYLNIIRKGAKESGLPEKYQKFLEKIPHNGYEGEVDIGVGLHLV